MELRFITPDLRALDSVATEVLAAPVFLGERPPRGTAGLVDYRLGNRVSHTIAKGALQGAVGEKVVMSGRPQLTYDKLLFFGAGVAEEFNQQVYAGLVEMLLSTLTEMGVRRAVVELPGRAKGLIAPELAAEILLERASENTLIDTWTLVDTPPAQRAINSLTRRDIRSQWGV